MEVNKNNSMQGLKAAKKGKYLRCKVCKNEFYVSLSRTLTAIYCSVNCKYKSQQNRIKLQCNYCKKFYERPRSYVYWANQRGIKIIFVVPDVSIKTM